MKVMMKNRKKKDIFFRIANDLRKEFSFVPILYGSLGVCMATKEEIEVHDIDLLVPGEFLDKKWGDLLVFMRRRKFTLKDEKEHEFRRGTLVVAFAGIKILKDIYATPRDIPLRRTHGAVFRLPTLRQFLATYRYSLRDGYRRIRRSDGEKIRMLEDRVTAERKP